MSSTPLTEIFGVRAMLNSPLNQSPSVLQIVEELEAEYQTLSNDLNNTSNAWAVETYTLTATQGVRAYQITATDFFKALVVTTVPANDAAPENVLEFTELEHLPQEWSWLGENHGQLLDSRHSSALIAFYRKLGTTGEEIWCEIRPTPIQTETYKITYMVGDWWSRVFGNSNYTYSLPHPPMKHLIRAMVAKNLLLKGAVKWSYDPAENLRRAQFTLQSLEDKIARYNKIYQEYKDGLDGADIVYTTSWAQENIFDS